MRADPRGVGDGRRRHRQHVRVRILGHVRQRGAREEEGATDVQLGHQVEPTLIQVRHAHRVVSGGVVDDDIDAAVSADDRADRLIDLRWLAQVTRHGEAVAADRVDLADHVRQRAWPPRDRTLRAAEDAYLGARTAEADGDALADAARCAAHYAYPTGEATPAGLTRRGIDARVEIGVAVALDL